VNNFAFQPSYAHLSSSFNPGTKSIGHLLLRWRGWFQSVTLGSLPFEFEFEFVSDLVLKWGTETMNLHALFGFHFHIGCLRHTSFVDWAEYSLCFRLKQRLRDGREFIVELLHALFNAFSAT
jgi:hypothetical protein